MVNRLRSLAVVVATVAACGCATTREKQLEMRVSAQEGVIDSLRSENERLQSEMERVTGELETSKGATASVAHSVDEDRAALADQLKGSGLSVGVREGHVAVLLPAKVFFAPGKASLSSEGKQALKQVAGILKAQFPGKVIRVEGHTDNTPIRKSGYPSNLELSNHRAEIVWHYLVEQCGINPRNIYAAGFGEYRPIADNATESGRQKNRRVELVVIQD